MNDYWKDSGISYYYLGPHKEKLITLAKMRPDIITHKDSLYKDRAIGFSGQCANLLAMFSARQEDIVPNYIRGGFHFKRASLKDMLRFILTLKTPEGFDCTRKG